MRPIDILHIGPQKSGTTWFYENLKHHPEIAASKKDTIHYFDIFFARGEKWLEEQFIEIKDGQKIFDPTTTYIRSPLALERLHKHNPKAKIILTLRNPIDRAYSHYWHEYKKQSINYDFEDCLKNFDTFQNWIEPGLPVKTLSMLYELFGKDQVMIVMYEDLKARPRELLREVFEFFGVDPTFEPAEPEKVVNAAGHRRTFINRVRDKGARILKLHKFAPRLYETISGRDEYKKGVPPEFRKELQVIITPMVRDLEALSSKDLSHWLKSV